MSRAFKVNPGAWLWIRPGDTRDATTFGLHFGGNIAGQLQTYKVTRYVAIWYGGSYATSNVRFNSSYGGGGDAAIANNSFGGGHEMKENEFNLLLFVDLCSDSRIYRRAERPLLCVLVVAFRSAGICR